MQAERVETGWATVWILALVAEVAMLMFLAGNLRAAQQRDEHLASAQREIARERAELQLLIREIEAASDEVRRVTGDFPDTPPTRRWCGNERRIDR